MSRPTVKPLEWSEPKPPTKGICSYDHCTAESAVGVYQIEWKGWKSRDGRTIYFNNDYVDVEDDLESAKDVAQQDYETRVLSSIIWTPDYGTSKS